jgi:hypothetical protein
VFPKWRNFFQSVNTDLLTYVHMLWRLAQESILQYYSIFSAKKWHISWKPMLWSKSVLKSRSLTQKVIFGGENIFKTLTLAPGRGSQRTKPGDQEGRGTAEAEAADLVDRHGRQQQVQHSGVVDSLWRPFHYYYVIRTLAVCNTSGIHTQHTNKHVCLTNFTLLWSLFCR